MSYRFLPLVLAISLAPGCFGSFKLTTAIWEFNRDLSDSIIVQEVVFLAFVIVPVYEIGTLADAIVLNTIEAFTGNNPVGANEVRELDLEGRAGRRLVRRARRIELVEGERTVRSAELAPDGSLIVTDEGGRSIVVDPATVALASHAWQTGGAESLEAEVRAALAR